MESHLTNDKLTKKLLDVVLRFIRISDQDSMKKFTQ